MGKTARLEKRASAACAPPVLENGCLVLYRRMIMDRVRRVDERPVNRGSAPRRPAYYRLWPTREEPADFAKALSFESTCLVIQVLASSAVAKRRARSGRNSRPRLTSEGSYRSRGHMPLPGQIFGIAIRRWGSWRVHHEIEWLSGLALLRAKILLR